MTTVMPQNRVRRLLSIRRVRFVQAFVAISILLVAELSADRQPLGDWWFWIGTVAVLTASVLEPYYTGAGAALLYGIGGLAAAYSADRLGVESLWSGYIGIAALVSASALICLLTADGTVRRVAVWFATRLGRPLLLGGAALFIEVVRLAARSGLDLAVKLGMGAFLAVLVASLDWYRLWALVPAGSTGVAVIETAIEPNLLLVSTGQRLPRGTRVQVSGHGTSTGIVAANLAHRTGFRIQIVLDDPWDSVTSAGGAECVIQVIPSEAGGPVALAAEGSTERALVLHPLAPLKYGDAVYWSQGDNKYLYQVTGLRLERDAWDGSVVVTDRVAALQLGALKPGSHLEFSPALPGPYELVKSAGDISAPLLHGFVRLGVVSGTKIEFGVSASSLRQHHLAILGMSGMGKSTVSRRICEVLSTESFVVAMDGTSEYRTRFAFESLDETRTEDLSGMWVYEPAGEPARKAMDFITLLMQSANIEYAAGQTPRPRTLLLEEAHAYLPEWNFNASKNESEWVSKSCRYILQARKFSLGFILVSQRTAVISKSALSQCESYIIFRTLDGTSLEYIESVLGKEMRDAVSSLSRFQAVCVGPAFSTATPVIVELDAPA